MTSRSVHVPLELVNCDLVLAMLGVTTAQLNPLTSLPTEGSTSLVTLGGEATLVTWTGGDLCVNSLPEVSEEESPSWDCSDSSPWWATCLGMVPTGCSSSFTTYGIWNTFFLGMHSYLTLMYLNIFGFQ